MKNEPTLRDQFAMAALTGILANQKSQEAYDLLKCQGLPPEKFLAEAVEVYANAMMESRKPKTAPSTQSKSPFPPEFIEALEGYPDSPAKSAAMNVLKSRDPIGEFIKSFEGPNIIEIVDKIMTKIDRHGEMTALEYLNTRREIEGFFK